MADSLNTRIADRLTRRRLQVGRVETTLRRQAWAVLALLERDIASAIAADDPTAFAILSRRRRAVEILMDATIAPLIASRYAQLATQTTEALVQLAQQEVATVQTVVNAETEAPTLTDLPSARFVQRAVTETLIPTATSPTDQAATGDDWWQRQGESLQQRLQGQLLVGVTRQETLPAVVARVRGTSANGFRDGLMERARQDAARLLTTQVTHAVSEAHRAVADANGQAVILIHVSVLDSRTSLQCLGRAGLRFTVPDHEPIGHSLPYLDGPPFHPSCRSLMVLGLRDGGAVASESLPAWLHRQGEAFQNSLLGPTRARLWRSGSLGSLRTLLDAATGQPLTLEELGA